MNRMAHQHQCGTHCVCPTHGTPLIYAPASDDHACHDVHCEFGNGGVAPAVAAAYGVLISRVRDEQEARAREARQRHDRYVDEARWRGVSAEDAEKILAVARDHWHLVGEPYQFATAALAVFAPAPEAEG
jgi:hypothetical protein